MKKFLMFLGILLLIFCGFIVYDTYFYKKIPLLSIEEEKVVVNKLYIYGTHLNMEGRYNIDGNVDLVLYNGEFLSYKINSLNGGFNLSNFLNDGIYLDSIPCGDYYLFLRSKYTDGDKENVKYYALSNNSEYTDTTYYTMSHYGNKITINSEDSYPTMMLHVKKHNQENIYDVVIDPGHGGIDGGASKNGYKETDFTMKIALGVKKGLEEHGLKVKLTHEEDQLSNRDKLEEYGNNGRAVIPRKVNAKYLFSIHLNSSNSVTVSGLEIYTAKNINYDFAKYLGNNIISTSGLKYSNNKINKVFDGIYSRNFTEENINSSIQDYNKKNLNPYNITTNSNYYYIIRETGGIVTGAYVDDRNSNILANPYVNSNVGTEAYLLELGYLSNKDNLNNVINNLDNYVVGIVNSIKSLYTIFEQ